MDENCPDPRAMDCLVRITAALESIAEHSRLNYEMQVDLTAKSNATFEATQGLVRGMTGLFGSPEEDD